MEGGAVAAAVAFAVLCIVEAYSTGSTTSSRFGLLWCGTGVLTVTAMWVFLRRHLSPPAGSVLVVVAGAVSYLPKLLRSSTRPAYFDELLHLHQAGLLASGGVVLGHNEVDPTVGYFPVFQLLVVLAHDVSGWTLWRSALLVAGIGHVLLVLAVYLLIEEMLPGRRIGGLAAVLYLTGPAVLFWMSQASYETVALPASLLTLWAAVRWTRRSSRAWLVLTLVGIAVTTVSQPVSSAFLTMMLLLLGAVAPRAGQGHQRRALRGRVSAFLLLGSVSLAATCLWFAVTAWSTIWSYLLPSTSTVIGALAALLHVSRHRRFYATGSLPGYERYCGYLALVGVLIALAAALALHLRGRLVESPRPEERASLRAFFVLGALFVATYPFNLSPAAVVWVHRSWQLLWLGVCALLACLLAKADRPTVVEKGLRPAGVTMAACAVAVVLLLGNSATTTPAAYMFPGSYHFGDSVGLVTSPQLQAAAWMREHAPGARIASDVDTSEVQWAYGAATPVTFPTWEVTFTTDPVPPGVARAVTAAHIQYLVVDRLMYAEASATGFVYSSWEPSAYHESPVPPAAYDNLLATPWLRDVYSNSQITIFRVLAPHRAGQAS